jgi:hypothetical protein
MRCGQRKLVNFQSLARYIDRSLSICLKPQNLIAILIAPVTGSANFTQNPQTTLG